MVQGHWLEKRKSLLPLHRVQYSFFSLPGSLSLSLYGKQNSKTPPSPINMPSQSPPLAHWKTCDYDGSAI